jgi:hypothetical protein
MLKILLSVLLLNGCATLQQPKTLAGCAVADVGVTLVGVKLGLIKEANPLWAATVNAGHPAAFVLASIAAVVLLWKWNEPDITAAASGVLCASAGRNLFLMR